MVGKNDHSNIYIHDRRDRELFNNPNMKVGYSTSNYVRLEESLDQRLPEPYNRCIKEDTNADNDSMIHRTIAFNEVYKKEKCYFICFFREMSKKYNCSFSDLYEIPGLRNCLDLHHDFDLDEHHFNYDSSCNIDCPFECTTKTYTLFTNQIIDTDHFLFGDDNVSKHFELFFYFDQVKVTKITQFPKEEISDLVSKIGGTVGVFIGCRLLSLVDILEFILEVGYLTVKKFLKIGPKVSGTNI